MRTCISCIHSVHRLDHLVCNAPGSRAYEPSVYYPGFLRHVSASLDENQFLDTRCEILAAACNHYESDGTD